MNGDDRTDIQLLRVEVNGKLDLLLERTENLKETTKDHEKRLRAVEEYGSPTAREAATHLKDITGVLGGLQRRVWYAGGAIAACVFAVNVGIAKHWF